ncbi:probable E3 ubiquitin-protein ligase bre1 [Melanaphis sacchari]|uniref:probable E3 ubiquitin-protein ligase bre1 n=1 Tax=Melanaphis sacchari TaxID=742174 RepID=UPI000DC1421E|nr:probable E3 ubiquitin-protein ligase bre1 [Melanaphis sacchari]
MHLFIYLRIHSKFLFKLLKKKKLVSKGIYSVMQDVRNALESYRQRLDCTMNAVRTHIKHFIGSNPLLESTSCTDPVKNLKNPSKQISRNIIKTPQIVLNLTETDRHQTQIRSRSSSPFWIKGETSTYSEVVKTGCVLSRKNSRSPTPELKQIDIVGGARMSRKSSFNNLLKTPLLMRDRSKSPKDRWQSKDIEKNTILRVSPQQKSSSSAITENEQTKEDDSNYDNLAPPSARSVKRRSRSRKNRNISEKDSGNKSDANGESPVNIKETVTPLSHAIDTSSSSSTKKPEIVVSDVKIRRNSKDNLQSENLATQISATCNPVIRGGNWELLTVANAAEDIGDFSKSRRSLDGVLGNTRCSDSCFDLNERLKGIFGSVNQKHYRHHRVIDRPRSKSDTRDLNELTQIFTNPNTDEKNKYTCRFERSAGSVKTHLNRDSSSGRRSIDNTILSPFGNTQMQRLSDGTTDMEHDESTIKSHLQALSDESIPLELAMKPFMIFDEGHTALQELTSTQTLITSLITDDSDQSQTKAIKELKTCVEQYEQILIELETNEDKDELYDLSTKIIKLKEIITRYKSYEEIEEFQILIVHLRTIVEKLGNLEINRNNIVTQKKLKDADDIICYYENWLLKTENDGPKYVDDIEEKIIQLKDKLHQLKTYEDNVEYETRVLKFQYIIEKLGTIKDNFTKLNQKDTKYNVESTIISTELSCMNSPKDLYNTSVESMTIPKLNYSLNHPKIGLQSQEKYCAIAPSIIKNVERENEINTISTLKDSEVLRSPKLVRKMNQALRDEYKNDKIEINVDSIKILGSLEQTGENLNRFEIDKPLEKTIDVNTQFQSEKIHYDIQKAESPEKKEEKKSKGFLRFKMPNIFMKKSKQGEIDNESIVCDTPEQNVDIESDNVKLLMYKRMSSISNDNNILQQNENQLNSENNKNYEKDNNQKTQDKDLSYIKEDNSTTLTSINDKVARIIEQNKLKYPSDKTIHQVEILKKNQLNTQNSNFPITPDTQIIISDPDVIINSRKTVRHIIVIDGKEIIMEDIIDEPKTGEPIKNILRKITKDGQEEVENISDPEKIENMLRLSETNDNVENTCVTITKTSKTILSDNNINEKEYVVGEKVDRPIINDMTEKFIRNTFKDDNELDKVVKNPDKIKKLNASQEIKNDFMTESKVTTTKIQKIIKRKIVDGKDIIDEEYNKTTNEEF